MDKALRELVIELMEYNQRELEFAKGNGLVELTNYYQGKIDAYRIISEYSL